MDNCKTKLYLEKEKSSLKTEPSELLGCLCFIPDDYGDQKCSEAEHKPDWHNTATQAP